MLKTEIPPEMSVGDVRKRVTSLMVLTVSVLCGIVGVVSGLAAIGVFENVVSDAMSGTAVSISGTGIFLGGLVAFTLHQRYGHRWPIRVLCLSLALLIVFMLPHVVFEHNFPQAILIPILVSAVLCEAWFVALTAVLTAVLTYAVHGHMPVFGYFAPIFNGLALCGLVILFRWIQDLVVAHQVRESERVTHLALHDVLTGLPNRRLVQDRLDLAIERARRTNTLVAVLFVDLDHFARINDTLGHDAGDAVISALAHRLGASVRTTDTIGRFGGDEFVVVLTEIPDTDVVRRVSQSILDAVQEPVDAAGHVVHITVSVGVAFYPNDGNDAQTVVRFADQALYEAKAAGRNMVRFSTPDLQQKAHRWFDLAQDLREAHLREELHVVYQPIKCFRTGQIRKAEALVRWRHPDLGPIGPNEFIPIAESTGSIHELGDWVLREAACQAVQWRKRGLDGFRVSVNRSPVQFREDRGKENPCLKILDSLGVPTDVVTLELTENVLLDPDPETLGNLASLRTAGIRLSLDDFGTGYSSLSHLHSFDMDLVKIDRRFVADLEEGTKNFILCQGIILIAHALGLEVVAEGIETEEQHRLLLEMGCDYGQGYYIGRPAPPVEFAAQVNALALT